MKPGPTKRDPGLRTRADRAGRISVVVAVVLLLSPWSVSSQTAPGSGSDKKFHLKWLGTAGWEMTIGNTVVLIDPFLTRREAKKGEPWKTDDGEVLKLLTKADYIFAGHSHADHIADIPCIAKRFGSKVIGSAQTRAVMLKAGVNDKQIKTVSGGSEYKNESFHVKVIESKHGPRPRTRTRPPQPKEIAKPCALPIMGDEFADAGSVYLYYFTIGDLRILHQSTGGFISEKLAGLRPEIALLYPMRDGVETMLDLLRPKTVVMHHFDEWRTPFSDGIPEDNLARAKKFTERVKNFDSKITAVIPKFFENPLRP